MPYRSSGPVFVTLHALDPSKPFIDHKAKLKMSLPQKFEHNFSMGQRFSEEVVKLLHNERDAGRVRFGKTGLF